MSVTTEIVRVGRLAGISTQEAMRLATSRDALTLRDQFAMAALTGMFADSYSPKGPDTAARRAYEYADAMLAARESAEPNGEKP